MRIERKNKTLFFIGLAIFLLIFFHYIGWISWVDNISRYFLIPISTKIYQTGNSIRNIYDQMELREKTGEEFQKCQDKLRSLNFFETKIALLEEENLELKKQLEFKNQNKFKIVSAEISGKDMEGLDQILIINRGESSGIAINQPVIVGEGSLIGKVVKTNGDSAFVRLINDSQSKVASEILNDTRSMGVVEGGYGLSLRMKLIPRNETALVGQKVITSGLETNMPEGLLIGEISVVENEAYMPFQQAVLIPSADFSRLNLVSVIIGK